MNYPPMKANFRHWLEQWPAIPKVIEEAILSEPAELLDSAPEWLPCDEESDHACEFDNIHYFKEQGF